MEYKEVFVDLKEASEKVLAFIGSETYNKLLSCIEDNSRAGLMAGLSFAMITILTECNQYTEVTQVEDPKIKFIVSASCDDTAYRGEFYDIESAISKYNELNSDDNYWSIRISYEIC